MPSIRGDDQVDSLSDHNDPVEITSKSRTSHLLIFLWALLCTNVVFNLSTTVRVVREKTGSLIYTGIYNSDLDEAIKDGI